MKILLILCGIVLVALVILGTMALWNWLMPLIFGLTKLNFWQTAGVLLLSSILFRDAPKGKINKTVGRGKSRPRFTKRSYNNGFTTRKN